MAVIGAHVAIDIQEPHQSPALIDALARQLRPQLLGMMVCGETGELTPQSLDLRRAIQPEQPSEGSRVALLEMLGTLDTQQRHQ